MSPQPYPHLQAGEAILWYGWLQLHGTEYDSFEYDVRVGEPPPVDPSHPVYIQAMARHLGKLRIDAVGYRGGVPTIFVIMRTARRAAAGALDVYPVLYRSTFAYQGELRAALVTHLVDSNIRQVLEGKGVQVYVMPRPEGT